MAGIAPGQLDAAPPGHFFPSGGIHEDATYPWRRCIACGHGFRAGAAGTAGGSATAARAAGSVWKGTEPRHPTPRFRRNALAAEVGILRAAFHRAGERG